MSFEQATHDEVIKAVEIATEDDGVLTEQDRENQEVQKSLKMLTMMYDHENEPGNTEGRNMVLVGITKAAMEYNQDPQEIADLIFGEGVLSMNEFLGDAFENTENGTQEINYRLSNGGIMRGVYKEEQGIIEWTDLQRLGDDNAAALDSGYMSNKLYQFTKVENFEEAIEAARNRIWGQNEESLTADVRDTVSIDGEPTDGTGVDALPPSITLDINPDGSISTLDENGREIELTFDELLARLANTHDKDWALTQVENIIIADENGVLKNVSNISREVISTAISNMFENLNLDFSVDDIIQFFSSFRRILSGLELSFPEDTIRQIADRVFSDNGDLRGAASSFKYSLDSVSQNIFDIAMEELNDMYMQQLVVSVYTQTGARLSGEQIQDMIGYSSFNMRDGHTFDSISQQLGIPVEYLTNNDGSIAFKRGFPGVSKEDINF